MTAAPRSAAVTMIGCGGLGSPAARALAASGLVKRMRLVDDDTVDVTNLHRQTLYGDEHLGEDKTEAAARVLGREFPGVEVEKKRGRMRPDTAASLFDPDGVDIVVEGADNYATKFLSADAARVHGVAVAHAGAVRWTGWAMLTPPRAEAGPCLRCVFEDIPRDRVETCATAGVIGPVVGVVAALQATLALWWLRGDRERAAGSLFHYDGLAGRLRRVRVSTRPGCPLCEGRITDLDPTRYSAAPCAA